MPDESPRAQANQGVSESSAGATGGQPAESGGLTVSAAGSATRRQLLKAGVGFAGVAAFTYGFHRTRSEILAATDGSALDDVPGTSEFVFRWTGRDLFTTEEFLTALDTELQTLGIPDATTGTALFDTIESATGIDPRTAGAVTGFGRYPRADEDYAGLLFESGAEPAAVRAQIQRGALTATSEYGGQELWGLGNSRLEWSVRLTHFGGGRYGLGTAPELEDVVDVRAGEAERIGGNVRRGLGEAEGLVRAGFVLPPAAFEGVDLPITGLAENVEYGSASLVDGELTVRLVAPSASVASDLEQTLTVLSDLERQTIVDQVGGESPLVEVVLAVLDDVETTVEGSVVRLTVADGYRVPAVLVGFLLDDAVIA
jgi:hypothetical protein